VIDSILYNAAAVLCPAVIIIHEMFNRINLFRQKEMNINAYIQMDQRLLS
jgi:hypothetical protein